VRALNTVRRHQGVLSRKLETRVPEVLEKEFYRFTLLLFVEHVGTRMTEISLSFGRVSCAHRPARALNSISRKIKLHVIATP
jgi:hypothetical protein